MTNKETCGDYGGTNKKGEPCGQATDGGRCADHEDQMAEHINQKINIERMVKGLNSGTIDPENVSTEERRACIPYLRVNSGRSYEGIGALFNVSKAQIHYDMQAILERHVEMIKEINPEDVGAQILMEIERDISELRKQGDHRSAVKSMRDKVKVLQTLGFLPKKDSSAVEDLADALDQAYKSGLQEE